MPRIVVGALAAAGAATSALVGLVHSDIAWSMVLGAATASGLAAYLALPVVKHTSQTKKF
jgi:hypothetical protein